MTLPARAPARTERTSALRDFLYRILYGDVCSTPNILRLPPIATLAAGSEYSPAALQDAQDSPLMDAHFKLCMTTSNAVLEKGLVVALHAHERRLQSLHGRAEACQSLPQLCPNSTAAEASSFVLCKTVRESPGGCPPLPSSGLSSELAKALTFQLVHMQALTRMVTAVGSLGSEVMYAFDFILFAMSGMFAIVLLTQLAFVAWFHQLADAAGSGLRGILIATLLHSWMLRKKRRHDSGMKDL